MARGKVIFAEWDEDENSIYTISFVDREAFPHICRSIEQEYVTGVSMGCSVEYSVCNLCENKAEKVDDYCNHIKNRKARRFTGRVKNVRTGAEKHFNNELVFEYNYGIKFIELSAVVDPACPSCHIQELFTNDTYLKRVANIQNTMYMIKTSSMIKQASQEEIDQLNGCLETLESLSISLIQNRQQVEVEFASDLVGILSELQEFTDELVGAGYGSVEAGVPGVDEGMEDMDGMDAPMDDMGAPMGDMGAPPPAPAPGAPMPVAAETPMASGTAGSVSSTPNQPIKAPISPSLKPRANDYSGKLHRVADLISDLKSKFVSNETGEDDMSKRRLPSEKAKQKKACQRKFTRFVAGKTRVFSVYK